MAVTRGAVFALPVGDLFRRLLQQRFLRGLRQPPRLDQGRPGAMHLADGQLRIFFPASPARGRKRGKKKGGKKKGTGPFNSFGEDVFEGGVIRRLVKQPLPSHAPIEHVIHHSVRRCATRSGHDAPDDTRRSSPRQ